MLSEQAGPLNDNQRDFMSSANAITRRLERLNNDLSVILSQDGDFTKYPQNVDLNSVIEDSCRELSIEADEFGVKFDLVSGMDHRAEAMIDPVRFTQIVLNLLSNAVYHAAPGTPVRVRLEQSLSRVLFLVENQSLDPLPDDLGDWFAPLVRGASARERSPRGVGLGLTVVAHLARVLGGTVVTRAQSRTVTIGVVLPRKHAASISV